MNERQAFPRSTATQVVRGRILVGFMALFILLDAHPAYGGEESGKDVYNSAVKAIEDKKLDVACPLFEKSYQIFAQEKQQEQQLAALYALGFCEDDMGRLLRARDHYREFVSLHDSLSVPLKLKHNDELNIIKDQLTKLRIPKLTLTVPADSPPPSTRVLLDGKEIEMVTLGQPMEMDPGDHILRTEVPSWPESTVWTTPFNMTNEELPPVALKWPRPAPPPPPPPPPPARSPRQTAAIIVGGVGVAGLIAGAVIGGRTLTQRRAFDACKEPACSIEDSIAMYDNGRMLGHWATVGFGVGLAGAAVGSLLWFTAPKRADGETLKSAVHFDVLGAGSDGAVFGLRGSF